MMSSAEGSESGGDDLVKIKIGANSLRHDSAAALGASEGTEAAYSRRRRTSGHPRLGSLVFVVVLACLTGACAAFRHDPVTSPTRASSRNTLQSQKNLIDDVQEGETSRLQRLLPSAWRNKNMSSWEVVESVRTLRGGGIGMEAASLALPVRNVTLPPPNALDKKVGKVLRLIGRVVVAQSVLSLLTSNDDSLLTEVCARCSFSSSITHELHLTDTSFAAMTQLASRLLSVESATAVKTVRKILTQFGDHGVVDVFKEYPPRDVVSSILALSRLQKASQYYAEEHQMIAKEFNDPELLEKLARYAVFAKAAYGWKMDLAMRGRLHLGGDSQALLKETGINEEDLIVASWKARTHRPVSGDRRNFMRILVKHFVSTPT